MKQADCGHFLLRSAVFRPVCLFDLRLNQLLLTSQFNKLFNAESKIIKSPDATAHGTRRGLQTRRGRSFTEHAGEKKVLQKESKGL